MLPGISSKEQLSDPTPSSACDINCSRVSPTLTGAVGPTGTSSSSADATANVMGRLAWVVGEEANTAAGIIIDSLR
jgi:hypothetical protein